MSNPCPNITTLGTVEPYVQPGFYESFDLKVNADLNLLNKMKVGTSISIIVQGQWYMLNSFSADKKTINVLNTGHIRNSPPGEKIEGGKFVGFAPYSAKIRCAEDNCNLSEFILSPRFYFFFDSCVNLDFLKNRAVYIAGPASDEPSVSFDSPIKFFGRFLISSVEKIGKEYKMSLTQDFDTSSGPQPFPGPEELKTYVIPQLHLLGTKFS